MSECQKRNPCSFQVAAAIAPAATPCLAMDITLSLHFSHTCLTWELVFFVRVGLVACGGLKFQVFQVSFFRGSSGGPDQHLLDRVAGLSHLI